jgi:hypothetical protein
LVFLTLKVMPGVEADKHGLVVKEVLSLTRRYPSLLSGELVSRLEASHHLLLTSSPSSRSAVQAHSVANPLLNQNFPAKPGILLKVIPDLFLEVMFFGGAFFSQQPFEKLKGGYSPRKI